jgi:hypothetical protein
MGDYDISLDTPCDLAPYASIDAEAGDAPFRKKCDLVELHTLTNARD